MRKIAAVLLVGDVAVLLISLWLALYVRSFSVPTTAYVVEHIIGFIPVFLVSVSIFFIAGLYEKQTRLVRSFMTTRILGAQVVSIVVGIVGFFILPLSIAPKTVLALYLGISVLLMGMWRLLLASRIGITQKTPAVLVGAGAAVTDLFEEVNGGEQYAIRFIQHVVSGERVAEQISRAVSLGARVVVIDTRDEMIKGALPQIYECMLANVSFIEFSTMYEDVFDRVPLDHIDYAWLLACLPKRHRAYGIAKRVFDTVLALVGALLALPIILLPVLFLSVVGGHPFIFSTRIGKGDKRIRLVKLRTKLFYDGGDPEKQKHNRETRFGTFLRRTRIDELPQLWNVLTGDLSFIGPRPELPAIAATYQKEVPYYDVRHLITPGLSGWAQIRDYDAPRGGADIERTRRKLSYDLYYLKRRSFVVDMVIALKTLRALAAVSGR